MVNRSEVSWNQNVKGANYTNQAYTFYAEDIISILWQRNYPLNGDQFPMNEYGNAYFTHYERSNDGFNETSLESSL